MHPRPSGQLAVAAAVLVASACARSGEATSSFTGGSNSGPAETTSSSTGNSDIGSSTSSEGSQGGDVSTSVASGSTGTFDAGVQPDFEPSPDGCKGKIDFLFLVSRDGLMEDRQAQLAAAFPQFIDTIESMFVDFDYHIMVVDGDEEWGLDLCTDNCPTLECTIGQKCCDYWDPDREGDPCCSVPNYPCDHLTLHDKCDLSWGAGTVVPAGGAAPNKPCPIDGGRRYLVKGQENLEDAFTCIATVGISGRHFLGQALTAAMQKPINDYGGCNEHFLREDALLMVTFISNLGDSPSSSEGTPVEWAKAVLDAKHGDERSVVMLNIGVTGCPAGDRLCELTKMFTFHHLEFVSTSDWGQAFAEAASRVEAACAEFVPPPG